MATKREKNISLTTQVRDEFNEAEFSPVHYDQGLVHALIKEKIGEKRSSQKFVIIEGLCNSPKLLDESDRLELRLMDEFMAVDQQVGEVQAIIGL